MNGGRGRVGIGAMVASIACAVGFSLAACTTPPTTSTPAPSVVTSPRPTTTPSPTPTPTPDAAIKPERPAAMDEVSAAGAEAAAVYFLQLYPYVYATGDLEEWRELSHPECVFCASVITRVGEIFAESLHTEGGLLQIADVTSEETDPGRWYLVTLDLVESASQRVALGSEVVEEFPEAHYRMSIAMVLEDTVWTVREVTPEAQP